MTNPKGFKEALVTLEKENADTCRCGRRRVLDISYAAGALR